jgi:hypothetical protein
MESGPMQRQKINRKRGESLPSIKMVPGTGLGEWSAISEDRIFSKVRKKE